MKKFIVVIAIVMLFTAQIALAETRKGIQQNLKVYVAGGVLSDEDAGKIQTHIDYDEIISVTVPKGVRGQNWYVTKSGKLQVKLNYVTPKDRQARLIGEWIFFESCDNLFVTDWAPVCEVPKRTPPPVQPIPTPEQPKVTPPPPAPETQLPEVQAQTPPPPPPPISSSATANPTQSQSQSYTTGGVSVSVPVTIIMPPPAVNTNLPEYTRLYMGIGGDRMPMGVVVTQTGVLTLQQALPSNVTATSTGGNATGGSANATGGAATVTNSNTNNNANSNSQTQSQSQLQAQ